MKRVILLLWVGVAACSPSLVPERDAYVSPHVQRVEESVETTRQTGVLVMAHGADSGWNQNVLDAVKLSEALVPTSVAFGMANPYTLKQGLEELRDQGVSQVALVRMFLSGESFLEQTEYLLGLSDTRPSQFVLMGPAAADPEARTPLVHSMDIATHQFGLLESRHVGSIASDRAAVLSSDPRQEAVLLIAHGMGDEQANERVLSWMRTLADSLSGEGYADVEVATLREDWREQRIEAEAHIRRYVEEWSREHQVLVIPMRLSGFGPYAEVLTGLQYEAGEGLLPHAMIGQWVLDTANSVACSAGWNPASGVCPS